MYRIILRESPDTADALYLLGVISHQTGQPAEAVELLQSAISIAPGESRYHNLLGLDLMALGRVDEAETSFRHAITLDDSSESYNNLGVLLTQGRRWDEALAAFQQALARAPGDAGAHFNAGNAHRGKGEPDAAVECFRRAVEIDPQDWCSLSALGQTLQTLARPEEAVPFLRSAIGQKSDDPELWCALGDALQSVRELPAADAAYRRSLELNPELSRAWYSAGCARGAQDDYAAAAICFQKALEIHPHWPEVQHNLGGVLFKLGQVEEALAQFRQSAAGGNPAMSHAAIAVIIPGSPASDNRAIYEARRAWALKNLPSLPKAPIGTSSTGKLRIGYVSSFFPDHNWMKPVWGLINHHDRECFEVHLFSDAPASRVRHGYRPHAQDQFHNTTELSNQALADLIRAAPIDLLIDLNGYSTMHRLPLFAMRPAPVIVGWFNMFATTGIPAYDYLIGDDVVIPLDEEKFYCERIVRVPGSYLTFEVTYPVPPVSDSPYLRNRSITFGCLAPQYKITREVIEVWSKILQQVPESSLMLKNRALGSSATRDFVRALFDSHGIASQRVRFSGPSGHYEFLEAYGGIDIALDTFPYSGGTTTTEAIWQGVPVITFTGDRWVSRTSASILSAGGLGELVGRNVADYVTLAISLAESPDRLAELRPTMRARLGDSSVCDTQPFARNMEALYRRMWADQTG